MSNLIQRGQEFRQLHLNAQRERRPFLIANAWDAGSARILTAMGFAAIATSSGASAGTLGRLDGNVSREEAFEQAAGIAKSTALPVSADLEKCFADTPAGAAETIRLATQIGIVGASIEDATGQRAQPLFDFSLAVERVAAAVEAARAAPFPFTLTARTENFLRGKPDLDDTIRRLQAFEKAGADVLFAPGLPDLQSVRLVCQSLSKPFNFMVAIPGRSFSVAELADAGVARISLATSLYRAAMSGMVQAAREAKEAGTFDFLNHLASQQEIFGAMKR